MARGFESKDVEFQQAEAERAKTFKRALTAEERDTRDRVRSLELALAKACADRDAARSEGHRRMLQHAVAALEAELEQLRSRE